jgi:hypothetical protein
MWIWVVETFCRLESYNPLLFTFQVVLVLVSVILEGFVKPTAHALE